MKKQILTAMLLSIMFLFFLLILPKNTELKPYKIIKVSEADTFYIDINKNNIPEEDEIFKVKNAIALKPIKNFNTEKYAQNLGISIEDYLKVGYLARNIAKEELTNKTIYIKPPQKGEKYIDIYYKDKNLAIVLLKDGLAFVYEKSDNPEYFQFQNIKQIKENAKELSNLKFSLVNLKTNIVHKLNSEHFFEIKNGELYITKQIPYFNFIPCKSCNESNGKANFEYKQDNFKRSTNQYSNSIDQKFGNLELFLINPLENKRPSTSCETAVCKRIVQEINASKKSINLALYGINEQMPIVNALLNAKKRGVKIRAVADYSSNMEDIYPYSLKFINEFSAKTDSNKTLMHNKFIVFDDNKVLTGSANISAAGTGGYNANIVVLINSSELASVYNAEFNQMYGGKFSNKKEKSPNKKIAVGDFEITPYFSPQDAPYENAILPLVKNAKSKIYVSIFYLTDRNLINELINAKKRNVEVMILLDAVGAQNIKDRIALIRGANIPLKVENWGGKDHEKTMMIDDKYLIMGSCNFTISGFYKNDENILVIKNQKLASLYADYFLYLFNSIDNKYLKYIPRAESFDSKGSCNDGVDNNFDGKIDKDDDGCIAKKR